MAMIEFKCRQCGAAMEAPDSLVGKAEICPECGRVNFVLRGSRSCTADNVAVERTLPAAGPVWRDNLEVAPPMKAAERAASSAEGERKEARNAAAPPAGEPMDQVPTIQSRGQEKPPRILFFDTKPRTCRMDKYPDPISRTWSN